MFNQWLGLYLSIHIQESVDGTADSDNKSQHIPSNLPTNLFLLVHLETMTIQTYYAIADMVPWVIPETAPH